MIIDYSTVNSLKTNTLYYCLFDQKTNRLFCVEDETMTMEEFSTFLTIEQMENHVLSVLNNNALPISQIKYTTKHSSKECNIIMPFQFQDVSLIEQSFVECFFYYEVH